MQSQSLSLQVSNPALLLNHMAERYSSTSRILMEFVDNGLDDAESLFDAESGAYSREVTIDVYVSRSRRTLRILDNARGMSPETLSRVVMRVGESRKRGASFVNGQFGFGMQAFRAACSTLTVRSSSSTPSSTTTTTTHLSSTAATESAEAKATAFQIRVQREKDSFQLEPLPPTAPEASSLLGRTGTEVLLEGFDPQWVDETFSVDAIAREVESHFERLLARRNLQIRIWDADVSGADEAEASMRRCSPVDYAALCPGASVRKDVELGGGQVAVCNLCVLPPSAPSAAARRNASGMAYLGDESMTLDVTNRAGEGWQQPVSAAPARFFVGGRRIATCGSTASFARLSANRWTVWGHPQVVGFIDIIGPRNGPLQPVITRDEFKNTRGRSEAYQILMAECEAPLIAAIEAANERVSERSLSKLEDTITAVLAGVADAERKEAEERERREKAELKRRRREAAAAAKAAKEAEEMALAEAAALAEAEAEKPLAEKMAPILGSLLETVVNTAGDLLDPESAEARAALAAQEAAEAAAEAAKEAEWIKREEAERKRRERRMKKLAPAAEQFTVKLVRGLPGQLEPPSDLEPPDGEGASEGAGVKAASERRRDPLLEAARERSRLVGSVILVDSLHPDFQARWRQTRQGAPKVDERLCGYLATIVSSHYRERAYQSASRQRVDYAQAYEEMIGTYCKLEEGLRQVLPALIKEMERDAE